MNLSRSSVPQWLPFCFSAAIFAALWLTDHPKPMWDDLFFFGASHNLAQGGDCSNPMIVRQEFPSPYFFTYPPISVQILGTWLRVAGTSACSVTGFFAMLYFGISSLSIFAFRRLGVDLTFQSLVPLAVSGAFLEVGLRPEPLATVFFMAAVALTLGAVPAWWRTFFGSLFLVLSVLTAPRWLPFGVGFTAFSCLEYWRAGRENHMPLFRHFLAAVLGASFAGVILLLSIDFRVAEFWETFYAHAHERTAAQSKKIALQHFLLAVAGPYRWPLMLLTGLLLVGSFRQTSPVSRFSLFLAMAFPLAVMSSLLGHGSVWFLSFLLLLLGSAVAARASTTFSAVLRVMIVAVILLANASPIVDIGGRTMGVISTDKSANYDLALTYQPTPERPVLIDSASARYLYDYRLPSGCLDFQFAAKFPGIDATMAPLRREDVYVVGTLGMRRIEEQKLAAPQVQIFRPAGSLTPPFFVHPRYVYVVTGAECLSRMEQRESMKTR